MINCIAVTGITGHAGGYFLEELIKNNFSGMVRCLVRKTSNTTTLDKSGLNIEKFYGDADDIEVLKNLVRNADVVLHIANIHYSISVLKACFVENVSKAVLIHTTGIYSKFKIASEEYKQIEKEIDALTKDQKIKTVILRPTMIFGDMCDNNIHKLVRMVDWFPLMPEIDHGKGKIQPVNARDLGKAFYQACMTEDLAGNDYILSGERAFSLHELFDMIGECLGKKTQHLSVSMRFGKVVTRLIQVITFGKINYVERVLRMGEDRNFDHDDATRDFGYLPESFKVGLKREVDQYLKREVK